MVQSLTASVTIVRVDVLSEKYGSWVFCLLSALMTIMKVEGYSLYFEKRELLIKLNGTVSQKN